MDKTARLRLFFGLELPDAIKQRLLTVQQPIAGARWQRADQLHLTLVFLGSVDNDQLPQVCNAARNLPMERFDASVSGIDCFGRPENPKNLWAGVHPAERLTELHEALNQRLSLYGFGQEKRRFRPHITLSRFRKEAGSVQKLLQAHKDFRAGTFRVDRITLYQSTQGADGSVYTVLDRFILG